MVGFSIVPLSSLASWKENSLKRCISIPQFYVSVEGWRLDRETNVVLYAFEIGLKLDGKVLVYNCERRYSVLRAVHKDIQRMAREDQMVPEFPPKKFFGNKEPAFVRTRHRELHNYFDSVSRSLKIEQCEEFNRCFNFPNIKRRWTQEIQLSLTRQP